MGDVEPEPVLCRPSDLIEVRRIDNRGRGSRGVFATRDVPAGALLERAPVLLIPSAQIFGDAPEARSGVKISWYVFAWEGLTKRPYVALALGYGSIYNHSFAPNARYTRVPPDLLEFHALVDIPAGSEVLINYNGEPEDLRPVAFEVH